MHTLEFVKGEQRIGYRRHTNICVPGGACHDDNNSVSSKELINRMSLRP